MQEQQVNEELLEGRERQIFKALFQDHPDGKQALFCIARRGNVFQGYGTPDPTMIQILEGRRQLALEIIGLVYEDIGPDVLQELAQNALRDETINT